MFEFGKDLRKLFAQARESDDLGWVELIGVEVDRIIAGGVDDSPGGKEIEEVQAHIAAGKLPTKLAMTWDDRVSFLLTEGLQLKKVTFLDTVFEGTKADDGGFDTEVDIATGELRKLIPDLI